MLDKLKIFSLDTNDIKWSLYGDGHINESYLVIDKSNNRYILQKINNTIFKDVENLMNNIVLVTEHLQKKSTDPRTYLKLHKTNDDSYYYKDVNNGYWRLYDFVEDTYCLGQVNELNDFYENGRIFGVFQNQLSDFDATLLHETIPFFHDSMRRFENFETALKEDLCNRKKEVVKEIDFIYSNKDFITNFMKLWQKGGLPLRVTHSDTKLNNILFDKFTKKAICVIDLDTVMPGLSINDYGDSIRFGASTGTEDETDLSRIELSLSLFEAYTAGYYSACGSSLTKEETEHLSHGAKMMTLECGMRFLTDYLNGDTYFKISRPNHNLDRSRTQLKLVSDMNNKWNQMNKIVYNISK